MRVKGGAARLPITIELGAGWNADTRRVSASASDHRKLEFLELLDALGLVGKPVFRVIAGNTQRAVRLRVHGVMQPYPPELLRRAWDASAPSGLTSLPGSKEVNGPSGFPDAWLRAYLGEGPSDEDLLGRFLAELVLDVARTHPGCLIGRAQASAVASAWQQGAGAVHPLPDDELELLLRRLVELGVSVHDRSTLGQVVGECQRSGQHVADAVEVAFARLRPRQLAVLMHPVDLQELVTQKSLTGPVPGDHHAIKTPFRLDLRKLEESIYFELGLRLPQLVLTPSQDVPQGTTAVKLNHLLGRPVRSQPRDVVGVIQAEVLRSASRLLSVEEVEYELYQLYDKAFPQLVGAALTQISLVELTRVLRGLLAERVSIRDLRALLERLMQYATVPANPTRYVVLDQRIAEDDAAGLATTDRWLSYLAFARAGSGLRNYLSYRYTDVQDRLHAMLLDREFEESLIQTLAGPRVSHNGERRRHEQQCEAIRQKIWTALDQVGELAATPVVLTNTSLGRQALREAVASELPDLPIMARIEIRPEIRVESLLTIHHP